MNGGEIIAKVLQNHGVKYLFTLCGGHISPIFVSAQNIGIRVIDTRHEVNAVFAADAVARLTGIPGVAAVTAGPGLTNTITAIKNAYMAQSPLIVLGGGAATILKGRGSLQDIDQMSLMKPVVKWAARITKVKEIIPTLERAFAVAQEGVPGPVFIECPIDTLYNEELVREWYGAKSKDVPPRNIQERVVQWYINRHAKKIFEGKENVQFHQPLSFSIPTHKDAEVDEVVTALKKAKNPLMIIGSGAVMSPQNVHELSTAVQHLNIPVYLSGMARGLVGKDSELQMRHKRKDAIKEADFIILAGVPNDFRLEYGNHIGHRSFASINRSTEDLYKNKKPTIAIHADPQQFIIDLAHKYKAETSTWKATLRERDELREQAIDKQAKDKLNGMNPIELFRCMDKILDDNTILIADGGDFVATSAYTLKPRAPLSWLDPGVFGTLGVGAGFALGAKLVFPEKDVFIIYGDGSSGYSLVEYDTFVRHQLPVISVIGNDACWAQIARDQIEFLNSDCALTLAHSNYEMIGKAFGADGERVENIEAFKAATIKAKEQSRKGTPFIINAIIGKSEFRKGSISM
ncbi:MAG TPA: thiamine pyrophosphate-binding protein [Chitinophagales bacterium]|jgi:thiamine pyrophosphate-dependent acetolactate synthase large subunit-like protein|nr:thiamine pyrophosphate-binding protein [Chitinophagales bacterium]MBP6153248.1 thiamine pyrophosphate-binding protein [Chitinophagales bacterium]HQV78850.1 thiamine pyrophosphate-binding protein [Chitinophagales bacterium]HQW79216.1 thiamine pyrophosphate-binding protein [Chitinophagales bacterium]